MGARCPLAPETWLVAGPNPQSPPWWPGPCEQGRRGPAAPNRRHGTPTLTPWSTRGRSAGRAHVAIVLTSSGLLSAFVTLLVTIGPVETGAVFMGLTSGVHRPGRRNLAVRAVLIAGGLLTVFTLGGVAMLHLLHVSLPAFRVAGGVLLFMQAVTLVFSSPGLSSISEREEREARQPRDIAVFPLAFPLIAGPGALSAVVLLDAAAGGLVGRVVLLGVLAVCLLLTLVSMLGSEWLVDRMGETGADVVGRISGLLLAALAVQFVFDGLAEAPFFVRP